VEGFNKAYDYAMFLLNIRLRTEGELRGKMREKGYKGEAVEEVMAQLKDAHYVNDRRFAEVYLENLKKYKSWGYFGIKKKFMEKKLPMDIIESVLAEGMTEEEELEIAKRFIKKYEVRSKNQAEKAKAARKLAAKGFRGSVISQLVTY
jgi:regulatory protein